MYKSILTLLLSFFATYLLAQEKLFKIDYKLALSTEALSQLDSSEEGSLAMVTALAAAFAEDGKPQVQAWFNKDYIRVQTEGLGENIQITKRNSGESYILYPSMQLYTEAPDATSKVGIQETNDDFIVTNTADFPISLVPDTSKTIAGFPCKLAVLEFDTGDYGAEMSEDVKLEIWYNESMPSLYWGEYDYLKKLPGAALYIGAFGIGIEAMAVNTVDFDASLFEIPEDYELQEYGSESYDSNDIPLGHDLYTYQDAETELIGIKDADDNIITAALYTGIYEFAGDYAVVMNTDGLYGVINTTAQEVIPCVWDYLNMDTENQLLVFTEDGKMGMMNIQQEVVIPAKYDYLTVFQNGYATYTEGLKSGLLNRKGEVALPAVYETIVEYEDNKAIILENELYYLIDIPSKKKGKKGYDLLAFANEGNLLLAYEKEKYGYLSYDEKVVIPFQYYYATPFYDGIASVYETVDSDIEYINAKGEKVEVSSEW